MQLLCHVHKIIPEKPRMHVFWIWNSNEEYLVNYLKTHFGKWYGTYKLSQHKMDSYFKISQSTVTTLILPTAGLLTVA